MKIVVVLVLIIASLNLFSSERSLIYPSQIKTSFHEKVERITPLHIYLGSQLGLITADNRANDKDESGYQFNFKVLGSYFLETPYVFDLGIGSHFSKLSNRGDYVANSMFAETSLRYRPADKWQIGVTAHFMPMKDIDFTSSTGEKGIAALTGLSVYNQQSFNSLKPWQLRLGAKVLTDVNIPQFQTFLIMLDAQIGFDSRLFKQKR
jgi:hypothetical protein